MLKGKTQTEAKQLFTGFTTMLTSDVGTPFDKDVIGKAQVFSGVREYPVRVKCATLAWHTLMSALENADGTVSTE